MARKSKTAGKTATQTVANPAPEKLTLEAFLASDLVKAQAVAWSTQQAIEDGAAVTKLAAMGVIIGGLYANFSATRPGENQPRLMVNVKDVAGAISKAHGLSVATVEAYTSTMMRGVNFSSKTFDAGLYEACLTQDRAKVLTAVKAIGASYADVRSVLCPKKDPGSLTSKQKMARKVKALWTAMEGLGENALVEALVEKLKDLKLTAKLTAKLVEK
jgi:hypothetical protein